MTNYDFYRRKLPQYRARGATYFVTWRVLREMAPLTADERTVVKNALFYFDGSRYDLLCYVVMDDHVHVVVRPRVEHALEDILRSWKSFSARQINQLRGHTGSVWLSEYMDRIIRNDKELHEKITYILGNPEKRWPLIQEYEWVGEWDPSGERKLRRAG